jgi:hypothetical protein
VLLVPETHTDAGDEDEAREGLVEVEDRLVELVKVEGRLVELVDDEVEDRDDEEPEFLVYTDR